MGWVFTDEMRFYLHENEVLLDGMIRTQHRQIRYECRQGYCGSCRMTVLAKTGEIHYIKKPIAVLADNEILACCCRLTGSTKVSYQPKNEQQLALFDHDDADKH
ncbi:2Fe-2S iron-sulfur cluster-binding protein [Moraxella sp. ZJ142]|uniref:2Fe-2S iron-sulfur cluster-binding protein n=1 Tax=Moraxella marmotae TaxID=3344520 RepID=UPI0035D503E2